MPTKKEDLPGTLKRSPKEAQRTYAKTLDSAHEEYDSEEAAHRVAMAAPKARFWSSGTSGAPRRYRSTWSRRSRFPAESTPSPVGSFREW